MSAFLMAYLNYIMAWEGETDANITSLITEQEMFVSLGTFDADAAVESEFADLISEAKTVRDSTNDQDAVQIPADAAAVASIWTFGFGMARFLELEPAAWADGKLISSKAADLIKTFGTIDDDIAARISPQVNAYIQQYKQNNDLMVSKAPVGVDAKESRGYLMQFMAQVQRHSEDKKTLNIYGFRKWTESATLLFNAPEVNQLYAALDELNPSAMTSADAQKCLMAINGLGLPATQMTLAQALAVWVMVARLNVSRANIREAAENLEPEGTHDTWALDETDPSAFDAMDAMEKFADCIGILVSVVEEVLEIFDIVDVVAQSQTLHDKLSGTIEPSYKTYFDSIQQSSQMYNTAIANTPAVLPLPTPPKA